MTLENAAKARDRSVRVGILAGVFGRIVGLLAPFLIMPAMLEHLGKVNFGIWMTAVSVTSMALFMDFGIGNGLLTKLSKAFGENDTFSMRRLISTGYGALVLMALFVSIVLLVVILLGNEKGGALQTATEGGGWIIFITGFSFLLGIPVSIIQRIMLAHQMTVSSNVWQIFGSIIGVVSCYAVVNAQLSAEAAVTAYSMSPIVAWILATLVFFKKNKNIRPSFQDFSFVNAKELMALGSHFFFLSIITSVSLNSDNLIIATVLGADAVTEYVIPAKLASVLGLLVTTMFLPLWAANGDAIARKDFEWVRQTSRRMTIVGGLAVGCAGFFLAIFSDQIIALWMGRYFSNGMMVVAGLAVMYLFFAVASPHNMILNGVGEVGIQIKAWSLYLFISSGLKFFCLMAFHRSDFLPYIGAISYLFTVLPAAYFSARYIYNEK